MQKNQIEITIIENALDDYISFFIDDLLRIKDFIIKYDDVMDNINEISLLQNSLNNLNPENVIKVLTHDEINEIKSRFGFFENTISDNEMIIRGVHLLLSIELLKIQPFILSNSNYDIFLSHCSWDAREVLGIKLLLEYKHQKNVYVDWIDDKHLNFPRAIEKILNLIKENLSYDFKAINSIYDRNIKKIKRNNKNLSFDKLIGNLVINKLNKSTSLFYIQSVHYDYSRWMPYELGLAESNNKLIYLLPIKYQRTRKKYGKRSSFLANYSSIIDNSKSIFKINELRKI